MGIITGASLETIHNGRIHRVGSSNYILLDTGSSSRMFKDDVGVDTASEPSHSSANSIATQLVGTIIHCASAHRDGSSVDVRYSQFDTSTDQWHATITDEVVFDNVAANMLDNSDVAVNLFVISDVVYVFFNSAAELLSATNWQRVSYSKRSDTSASGTWGTAVDITAGGEEHYRLFNAVADNGGKIHISLYDGSDFQHLSLDTTSSDSLSSAETFSSSDDIDMSSKVAHFEAANGDEIVVALYAKNPGDQIYASTITNDGSPATEVQASDTAFSNTSEDEDLWDAVGSDITRRIYLLHIDEDEDIKMVSYDGSAWSAEVTLQTGTFTEVGAASVYVNSSGTTVLGYIYEDNGTTVYSTEYVLATMITSAINSDVVIEPNSHVRFELSCAVQNDVLITNGLNIARDLNNTPTTDVAIDNSISIELQLGIAASSNISVANGIQFASELLVTSVSDTRLINSVLVSTSGFEITSNVTQDIGVDNGIQSISQISANQIQDIQIDSGILSQYQVDIITVTDAIIDNGVRVWYEFNQTITNDAFINSGVSSNFHILTQPQSDNVIDNGINTIFELMTLVVLDAQIEAGIAVFYELSLNLASDVFISNGVALGSLFEIISSNRSDVSIISNVVVQRDLQVHMTSNPSIVSDILASHFLTSNIVLDVQSNNSVTSQAIVIEYTGRLELDNRYEADLVLGELYSSSLMSNGN